MPDTYAIVESGGKQYRVQQGDDFVVDRLREDEGSKVSLRAVMYRADGEVVLEPRELEKVKVEAKVAAHERGEKIRVFKYKAKKGYRRSAGYRSELTRLEITELKLLSRRPAKPKAKAVEGPGAGAKEDAGAKVAGAKASGRAAAGAGAKAEAKKGAGDGEAQVRGGGEAEPKSSAPKRETAAKRKKEES
jgi:large subunit ribosomal protein L21